MRKNKFLIYAIIALLLLAVGCSNAHKPDKKEVSVSQKEENVTAVSEPLPAETEVIAEKKPEKAISQTSSTPKTQENPAEKALPPAALPESEPQIKSEEAELFCTLTVRCDDVLKNIEKLATEKHEIIPANGFIFPKEKLTFTEGESVFDLLLRTMKERRIHMDFVDTPMYNSVYIKGIGNLYEFDCGDSSGWIYTINGESPLHGCSQHKVKRGDNIEFKYICSLY